MSDSPRFPLRSSRPGVTEQEVEPPAGVTLPVGVERIIVRRSTRRRRTVSARRESDCIIVAMPARTGRAEQDEWVAKLVARVAAKTSGAANPVSDAGLAQRATELSARYLDSRAVPSSVRWVGNQNSRWGSCTPEDASIRLSDRLRPMPEWVVDYVLLHELVHLLHPDHSDAFHTMLNRYERAERAEGFLDGWSHAAHRSGRV